MRASIWLGGAAALLAGLSLIVVAVGEPTKSDTGAPPGRGKTPILETHVLEGLVGCSVSGVAAPISTEDRCTPTDLERQTFRAWLAHPKEVVTSMYLRLEWTPTVPGTARALALTHRPHTAESPAVEASGSYEFQMLSGASPLTLRVTSNLTDPLYRLNERPEWFAQARSAAADLEEIQGDPTLGAWGIAAIQQELRFCLVLGYNNAEIPEAPDCTSD